MNKLFDPNSAWYYLPELFFILCVPVSVCHGADLSHAKVTFRAPTNVAMVVKGEAEGLQGEIKGNVGEAAFELKNLDTGLALRNKHMLEDLHAAEHPVAVMKWHGPVADLTMNGVTKTIALAHEGQKYSFEVYLPDFGLKGRRFPNENGIGVKDTVSVEVTVP